MVSLLTHDLAWLLKIYMYVAFSLYSDSPQIILIEPLASRHHRPNYILSVLNHGCCRLFPLETILGYMPIFPTNETSWPPWWHILTGFGLIAGFSLMWYRGFAGRFHSTLTLWPRLLPMFRQLNINTKVKYKYTIAIITKVTPTCAHKKINSKLSWDTIIQNRSCWKYPLKNFGQLFLKVLSMSYWW